MQRCRFEIPACPGEEVARLRRELEVSGALAQVLVRRGLGEPERARAFLAASEDHPPSAFAGIEEAVELLLRHLREGTLITVHGDYDVDGVCSTAIFVRTLRTLGAQVDHYLPDRARDGYGLRAETVARLARRGTRLLLTADCAITAVEEVATARALGLDVIVSDHHAPRSDGALPQAPIVHPAVCGYPCTQLCAAAVAHKLARALVTAASQRVDVDPARSELALQGLREDLDLVALATIADVVPLLDENRALVRRGLRALARTAKPGLRALMAVAGVDSARVGERAVGFALAPRLNAAGRLYRADAALELLLASDRERAGQIARELDDANSERRRVELGIRLEAEAQIDALGEQPAYVIAGEGWHPGVIGIVASRLVERSRRPVLLLAAEGERLRGSGRSVEGFDLLGALTACAEHLHAYGGHRAAAGLELERSRLDAFSAAFCAVAESSLPPEGLPDVERVDAVVGGDELCMELAEELQRLAPFGRGNPPVSLLVADASFAQATPMGEGRHVRFTVHSRGARARAVAFGAGARLPVPEGEPAQATFTLEVNEWNGISEPRLVLRRAQPANGGPPGGEAARADLAAPVGAPAPVAARGPAAARAQQREAGAQGGELVLFAPP